MKKDRLSPELKNSTTNADIRNRVFRACAGLLNEDSELSLELTNETAYPEMSDYQDK
ncbi:MAG: hypothetical protein ACOWWO_03925 [Peptococcaceae bacterium]